MINLILRTIARYKLLNILSKAVGLPFYKAGYNPDKKEITFDRYYDKEKKHKVTYCNLFARDILDSKYEGHGLPVWRVGFLVGNNERALIKACYSYDLSCLNPNTNIKDIIVNTLPCTAHENAIKASKKGLIKELSAEKAQERANVGAVIWCSSNTHEAIVAPDTSPFYESLGCYVAQAGLLNGFFYCNDGWCFGNQYSNGLVKFFEFPIYKI